MKNILITLMLALVFMSHAVAQSPVARFKFEDAEASFAKGHYQAALQQLEEAEQALGNINPPILYLRIMARHELIKATPSYSYAQLEQLRKDSARYLADYGTMDGMLDKAREVYRIAESLKAYPTSQQAHAKLVEEQRLAEDQARKKEAAAKARADERERRKRDFAARVYAIGDTGPGGGIIFFDKGEFSNGWRYMEAAPPGWAGSEEDPTAVWGCESKPLSNTKMSTGWGRHNTDIILRECPGQTAAKVAKSYESTVDGVTYNDWFLPSRDELFALRYNLHKGKFDRSMKGYYWASTHAPADEFPTQAWYVDRTFNSVSKTSASKKQTKRVRPVRYVVFR